MGIGKTDSKCSPRTLGIKIDLNFKGFNIELRNFKYKDSGI